MTVPDPSTITAWVRLASAYEAILAEVEAALKADSLPPLSWYDALLVIERAADGIRPFEIRERLLLPQYGTSRLLARLEAAGLVARGPARDDGRGQVVTITEEGRAVRSRMWPVYAGCLRTRVEERLSTEEREALAQLLERLR